MECGSVWRVGCLCGCGWKVVGGGCIVLGGVVRVLGGYGVDEFDCYVFYCVWVFLRGGAKWLW